MSHFNHPFVVPIFELSNKSNEKDKLIGTGFIIDDKLITAANIFPETLSLSRYYFNINGNSQPLKELVRREYYVDAVEPENFKGSAIYLNIQIFKVDIKEKSSLTLFRNNYSWHEILDFAGYSDNENIKDECSVAILETALYYPSEGSPIKLRNAFGLSIIENEPIIGQPFSPTNSGSPLLRDNCVYGMFVESEDWGETESYIAIKSVYIDYLLSIIAAD